MTEWREVCRWDVEPTPQVGHTKIEWRTWSQEEIENEWPNYQDAFSNMAAAFEELAAEHRELVNALQSPSGVVCSMPLAADGEVAVRPYKRSKPRRSKLVETEPDHPTVQAAPGEGQTGASGEATGHSPEGADPQIRDAYCRGRSGIPLGNWCNESQSGDATGADKEQPCPGCGSYRGTHGLGCRILALTQSGEERSE